MRPEIIFPSTNPYPVEVKKGDIVFIAGNPPSGRELPWEHVAIIAEDLTIHTEADFCNLRTYGLPESQRKSTEFGQMPPMGLSIRRYGPTFRMLWSLNQHWAYLSDPKKCWNLGGRPFGKDQMRTEEYVYRLSQEHGRITFYYGENGGRYDFRTTEGVLNTDCVGLVCWALSLVDGEIVQRNFDFQYPSPYPDFEPQFHPAPGHLAHALTGDHPLPYSPTSIEEAINCATAVKVVERYQ